MQVSDLAMLKEVMVKQNGTFLNREVRADQCMHHCVFLLFAGAAVQLYYVVLYHGVARYTLSFQSHVSHWAFPVYHACRPFLHWHVSRLTGMRYVVLYRQEMTTGGEHDRHSLQLSVLTR